MKKKFIILSMLCLTNGIIIAQQNQEVKKPEHSKYYYQKATLFELLPIYSNDIVFLGNSITDGGEWAEIFNMPNIKNRGISGDVTNGVYERLDNILKGKPKKIFLLIGINDINRGKSAVEVFAGITKIAEKIAKESPKTTLYIQSIFPEDYTIDNFKNKKPVIVEVNDSLKNYCAKKNLTYIDIYSKLITLDNDILNPLYSNDGLHLMGNGYMLWKEIITPYLKTKQ